MSDVICTRETCKTGDSCQVCKDAKCCGDCGGKEEKKSRTRTQAQRNRGVKKCKKCGNAIKTPPTMKEQGICEPETCGKELVCGGDCCAACGGIPVRCDADTCGEELDCFGKPLGETEIQPDTADEILTMGEHICKSSTCGNRIREDGVSVGESASNCCRMCSKPIEVKCDPTSCGESGEMTCEECLRGCCGNAGSNPKCGTCGIVGGGNLACGDCGGGPGGPTKGGVVCGKTVCGKEVECVECGGALCKDDTCESSGVEKELASEKSENPKCKKCLKKRLLVADCTKKTCSVCSGAPGRDGKVPTCCKKCVRQESAEDLDKKKSDSEIPPNIKRLVLHGWEADSNADDEEEGGGKEGTHATKGSPKVGGGAAVGNGDAAGTGDIGAFANAYCVPGNGCRNRCGVCR